MTIRTRCDHRVWGKHLPVITLLLFGRGITMGVIVEVVTGCLQYLLVRWSPAPWQIAQFDGADVPGIYQTGSYFRAACRKKIYLSTAMPQRTHVSERESLVCLFLLTTERGACKQNRGIRPKGLEHERGQGGVSWHYIFRCICICVACSTCLSTLIQFYGSIHDSARPARRGS